jgi:transcriptional regulator with XRE-family HTH domain
MSDNAVKKAPPVLDRITIEQIISLDTEGLTQPQIAKRLGISQGVVSKYLRKPEIKTLSDKLREKLQRKYVTLFTARKIRDEKQALELTDHAYNPDEIVNKTIYQTPEQIESFLNRQDKAGLKISQGTGILYPQSLNQINFNDNRQQTIISSAFQAFLDWEAKHAKPIDTQGDIESDDN